MASIGSLFVTLGLNASGFQKGLTQAKTAAQSFRSGLSGIGSAIASIQGAIAALGVTAAGGAFASLVKDSYEAIDATGKLSDRLGIAIDKLSGLQYAARLNDVEINSLATGLQKLNTLLGQAAGGSDSAAKAFADIGLNAAELSKLAPDVAFAKVADALNSLGSVSQKTAAGVEIFGRGFGDLAPLISEGSEGIQKAINKARSLNLILSDFDYRSVQGANDSVTDLKSSFQGLSNIVAVQTSPNVKVLAERLTELTSGDTAKLVNDIRDVMDGLAAAVRLVTNAINALALGFYALRLGAVAAIQLIIKAMQLLWQWVIWQIDALSKLLSLIPQFSAAGFGLSAWVANAKSINKEMGFFREGLIEVQNETIKTGKAIKDSLLFDDAGVSLENYMKDVAAARDAFQAPDKIRQDPKVPSYLDTVINDVLKGQFEIGNIISESIGKAITDFSPEQPKPSTLILDRREVTSPSIIEANSAASRLFAQRQQNAEAQDKTLAEAKRQTQLQEQIAGSVANLPILSVYGGF